jgi:hypothetical protein
VKPRSCNAKVPTCSKIAVAHHSEVRPVSVDHSQLCPDGEPSEELTLAADVHGSRCDDAGADHLAAVDLADVASAQQELHRLGVDDITVELPECHIVTPVHENTGRTQTVLFNRCDGIGDRICHERGRDVDVEVGIVRDRSPVRSWSRTLSNILLLLDTGDAELDRTLDDVVTTLADQWSRESTAGWRSRRAESSHETCRPEPGSNCRPQQLRKPGRSGSLS